MPTYRIAAQLHPNKTLGYLRPDKASSLSFTSDPKKAKEETFTLSVAKNWLGHVSHYLKQAWGNHAWFKPHQWDDVRLVLEEVQPDGSATVVDTSVDWTNRPTVTRGSIDGTP